MKDEFRQAIDTIPGFVWSALPEGSIIESRKLR